MRRIVLMLAFALLLLGVSECKAGITYNASTNTITLVGDEEKGNSSTNPFTFEDIYQASVNGSWGVVTKLNSTTYLIEALLRIGDGVNETWFRDENKVIIHQVSGPTSWRSSNWWVRKNAHFQLGELVDEETREVKDGCVIYFNSTGYHCFRGEGDTRLYACAFYNAYRLAVENNGRVWSCQFVGHSTAESTWLYCYAHWYQVNAYDVGWGFYLASPYSTYENMIIDGGKAAFRLERSEVTARNVKIRNCNYIAYIYYSGSDYSYFIDLDADEWKFLWYSAPNARAYRQYTFNLKVTDKGGNPIDNATVKVYDKNKTLEFETKTNSNGEIPEQIVTRGYYDQAHGNTLVDFSPHMLIVEKEGYETYIMYFTPERKIDWTVPLERKKEEKVIVRERKKESMEEGLVLGFGFAIAFFGLAIFFLKGGEIR